MVHGYKCHSQQVDWQRTPDCVVPADQRPRRCIEHYALNKRCIVQLATQGRAMVRDTDRSREVEGRAGHAQGDRLHWQIKREDELREAH